MPTDLSDRHPSTQHIAQFFESEHLPPKLGHIVGLYKNVFEHLVVDLEDGPELTTALRHLLDSKDAAVRQRVVDLKKAGTPPPANTPEPELLDDESAIQSLSRLLSIDPERLRELRG